MNVVGRKCPLPVLGHSAVSFNDMVLVWGGYTTAAHLMNDLEGMLQMEPYIDPKLVWIYQPEFNEWRPVLTKGNTPLGTSGAGVSIMDHYMYVFGGYTSRGNTSDIYRLDLYTMTWTLLNPQNESETMKQPSPRDKFMHCLYDEKLYIFGGFGTRPRTLEQGNYIQDDTVASSRGWNNQLFIYDTQNNCWSNPRCTGDIPSARAAGAATCIQNKMYLFGGRHNDQRLNDLFVLDLESLVWTRLLPDGLSPCGRSWHTLTAISQDCIILYGGYTQNQVTLSDVWLLNTKSLTWTVFTTNQDIPPRLWHSACYTSNNELVIFGGCSNDILSVETLAESHNEVIILQFSPYSLKRLCLKQADKHRDILQPDFHSLPGNLQHWLSRQQHNEKRALHDDAERGNAITCVLS